MRWTALSLSTLLIGGLACSSTTSASKGVSAPASSTEAPPPPPQIKPPNWLPVQAREMLAARMARHGEEMMYLTAMVLTVNYEGAAQIAEHIAEEPRIARPTPDEHGTISELLPTRFFELQDELKERAIAMAAAARSQRKEDMLQGFGRLTETCVSCHITYLQNDEAGYREGVYDDLDNTEQEPLEE